MNRKHIQLCTIFLFLMLSSCHQSQQIVLTSTQNKNTQNISTPQQLRIKGIVIKIEQGCDGYTACLKTNNHTLYYITASIANCGQNNTFKQVKIGQEIEVEGDFWLLSNEKHITVRRFY